MGRIEIPLLAAPDRSMSISPSLYTPGPTMTVSPGLPKRLISCAAQPIVAHARSGLSPGLALLHAVGFTVAHERT